MSEFPDSDFDDDVAAPSPKAVNPAARPKMKALDSGDDKALDNAKPPSEEADLTKGWMKFHSFELVRSVVRLRELVDEAIKVGKVALDTETQGLDTRIEFREDGSIYTRHQIVGYCLGIEGKGYYIPVRHEAESNYDVNPNIESVPDAEAEITRLCMAAQPILKEGCRDILGAKEKDFEVPPRVIIEFWHAKFDQEMLYPVTGIDIWNPASFDDGMLMVYALCTEDEQGLKENAYERLPPVKDPETGEEHRYEMIEFTELFAKGMKKSHRKLQKIVPREEGQGRNLLLYGCSDGICTNLLCAQEKPKVLSRKSFSNFYTLEKQVAQVVRVIERTRVLINKGEIASLLEEAEKELAECETKIRAQAIAAGFPQDFNPSSSAQLADFLFGPQGLWQYEDKPEKTSEGQYKTDEKTIEHYSKDPRAKNLEAFDLVIKHRQINKVRGTYLQNLADNTDELNQLRLNFRQTGAATGRFTAPKGDADHGYAGVPIQGIPARDDPKKPKVAHSLRRMFIAREGYILAKVDYASQELRITSSASGEQKWIAEYEKEAATGVPADLHYLTAQAFFPSLTPDSPDYKIKRNQGKCVHSDTLVLAGSALATMGSLGTYGKPDTFVDAPPGLTVDGNPVVSLYNGGFKDLVHVLARRGALTCTPEHRFKMKDGSFVRAGDLQPGMVLEGFVADGVKDVETHWRNISSVGPFLARHHYYNGTPAQIVEIDGGMVQVAPCPQNTPNTVLTVLPAGRKQCLDLTMGTKEHLYRANCLLTHNTANFALIYGGGVGAVQRATGCDKVEGARLKKAFDDSVPSFSKWVKRQHAHVKKNLGVSTAFGRFLAIPDANLTRETVIQRLRAQAIRKLGPEKGAAVKFAEAEVKKEVNKGRAACERKATNYPIQGAGADIMKISLVLLLREFHIRGWLKNGGDDSVRMIMTVHDEIVFEIKEHRVAEAIPVITQIMEYPAVLVGWRVPLVAEVELGASWAAHLNWSKMLKGKSERPKYLEGVVVDLRPPVHVLGSMKKAPASQPPPAEAQMLPPPAEEVVEEVEAKPEPKVERPAPTPITPPPVAKPNGSNGHSNGFSQPVSVKGKIGSFKLSTMHIDKKTAISIISACMQAKLEALKESEQDQEIPIEILLGGEDDYVLFSTKENFRVQVEELKNNLKYLNLLGSFKLLDEGHG